jgi:hypothetical protein
LLVRGERGGEVSRNGHFPGVSATVRATRMGSPPCRPGALRTAALHLMTGDGEVSLTQGIGDALLFRGRYLPHWGDQLPEGHPSSSILFHFVDG